MDAATWAKAKDLIGDALELPEADRDKFVAARCTDPALLAEIRSILHVYADASSFLERPPVAVDGLGDDPDDLPPGHQIGPYVVIDRLGRGGMGQVFLASDRRLKRKVALKRLLSSQHDRAGARVHILREARLAAQISHPHVAAIHDVLDAPEGVFIVMEYVEGESLAARLRRERPPLAATLSIGRQLASALAAAHAKGVIHRDLKPANVQVMVDGTVKVLDFGIAQAAFAASTVTTGSVAAPAVRVMIAGTPGYMSPEQMAGAAVDERSDLFSLGIVLFELIAGRLPFPGLDLRTESAAAAAARLEAAAPNTPRAVVDLVAKALEFDVLKRYQTALELDVALASAQTQATRLSHGSAPFTPDLWARIARAAAIVIGVVVILGLFGALTTVEFNRSLQRPERFAEESLWRYLWLGFQTTFMLLLIALGVAALDAGITFLIRVARLIGPVDRLLSRLVEVFRRARIRLGLDDPTIFGQCIAAFGAVALLALIVSNLDLMGALFQWASLAPAEQLQPLSSGRWKAVYRLSFDLLLIALGVGLWRLLRLRRSTPNAGGGAAFGMLGAVITIVVLIHIVPYRILFQNRFERVSVAGIRCYLINERDREVFVFCPESALPRSHVLNLDRTPIDRSGQFESMFTPPFGPPSSLPR